MLIRISLIAMVILLCSCADGVRSSGAVPRISSGTRVADMPVAWASPNVFETYNPKGDSVMKDSWTRKFDASGISFNEKQTCTLVTRQHVVMANHYKRKVMERVIFHDRGGRRLVRHLVDVRKVYGDVAVGRLNQPVPAGYKVYPLLRAEAGLGERLKGELVLVTDQNRRVFVHEVARVSGANIGFGYDKAKGIGFAKHLVSGDSGNPSFMMKGGEPVLIETHTSGGFGTGPFYGSEVVQRELARVIGEMGGEGRLRFVRW